jgi:hypothetical protein
MKRVFTTVRKKQTVENESWFYHIFRKNSVLVHAKTTTSYDTVENALIVSLERRFCLHDACTIVSCASSFFEHTGCEAAIIPRECWSSTRSLHYVIHPFYGMNSKDVVR